MFSDVFEDAFPGMTLLDVLKQGGGGLNALGRHTVAALLNASSPIVYYDVAVSEIIDSFNAVFPEGTKNDYNTLKDFCEAFNEQGCPLGNNSDGKVENDDPNEAKTNSSINSIDLDNPEQLQLAQWILANRDFQIVKPD